MGPFEMVVLIVLIITIAGVSERYLKTRKAQSDSRPGKVAAQQEQRIAEIEKRLRVLESIVTSDGYDLKQKFKELDK